MKTLFLILFLSVYSNSVAQVFLTGKIVDIETNEPLPYTTIFLNNTTIGSTSNEEGNFSFKIPEGEHEIIVKYVGYQILTYSISTKSIAKSYLVKLEPEVVELGAVTIEAKRDKEWYRNLAIFKSYFIGTTKNALACEILNPTDLVLSHDKKAHKLLVTANAPIRVKNTNLGYEIEYLLQNFEYAAKVGKVGFSGYPLYRPLELTNRKAKKVKKHREVAYNGSIMHFLRSVSCNELDSSDFIVRKLIRSPNPNRPSEEVLESASSLYKESKSKKVKDSLINNYLSKRNLSKTIDNLISRPLKLKEFTITDDSGNLFLKFNNLLHVVYKGEVEEVLFVGKNLNQKPGYQTTILHLLSDHVKVDTRGIPENPNSLYLEGYMGWEKVGDMLPLDYVPSNL